MANLTEPVIVAVARTPFGRFEGALSSLSAAQLGACAINEALARVKVSSADAVYAGVGMIGGATLTVARQAVLMSNLPVTTPSLTVDRACCSSMTAIGLAWKDILAGQARAIMCGGFESLSRTPLLWPRQRPSRPGSVTAEDPLLLRAPVVDRQIAIYSGEEALRHGVTRAQQDEWAVGSHAKYQVAQASGYFAFERMTIDVESAKGQKRRVEQDESPRMDTTVEKLAALKPIYGGPTITAGNAPGLNDGAAFLLVMHPDEAARQGLAPLARIADYVQLSGDATSGTYTPALSIQTSLKRRHWSLDDLALIEINEAYAATPLVSTLRLGDSDAGRVRALRAKTNVHGGAVAIGHPMGASGARLAMTLIAGLRARGGGRGAAAICGGFGQGDALLLEVDA